MATPANSAAVSWFLMRFRDRVPGNLEPPQRGDDMGVCAVAGARALDGVRVGDERCRTELADARVELLVAGPEGDRGGRVDVGVGFGEDLAQDPPVGNVVVPQASQVHHRRLDIGLIDPCPGVVVLD